LAPGNYIGKATIDPTTQYKNGLICTHNLTITKNPDGLTVINRFKAFHPNTHKLQYQGYRDIKFLYKPNHPNQLFKISKSYINDKIVSSSYGYATGKTKNSILFHLTGSWHVDNRDFHKITWTARRTVYIQTRYNQHLPILIILVLMLSPFVKTIPNSIKLFLSQNKKLFNTPIIILYKLPFLK
jgi:hypothetical protein